MTEATCDTPKTCAECGEIEGEVLEHVWVDATYTNPKTCELCGTTEGTSIPVCVEKKFSHKSAPVYNSKFEYDADGNLIKEEYTEGSEELGWEWVEISEYTYAPLN